MKSEKKIAIILAAGQGKRMKSKVQKQYMLLKERPVLYYSLKTFQESNIDEIILVVGQGEIPYCQKNIVDKYQFDKVTHVIEGGQERYHSVYNGIKAIKNADYVYIHDGARPFVSSGVIESATKEVRDHKACVVGVLAKDTIKLASQEGFVANTPNRDMVWQIQTPQVFEYALIKEAYEKLMEKGCDNITDDAMVVETMLLHPVKLVMGDYRNFKITTPEDIQVAELFLK